MQRGLTDSKITRPGGQRRVCMYYFSNSDDIALTQDYYDDDDDDKAKEEEEEGYINRRPDAQQGQLDIALRSLEEVCTYYLKQSWYMVRQHLKQYWSMQ